MTALSRRSFLAATAAGGVAACARVRPALGSPSAPSTPPAKPALVLATDLYRPHGDPDDHWDLASVFALAQRGLLEPVGVVIDYPLDVPKRAARRCDPDVLAVAQMNYLTGRSVPVMVGSPQAAPAAEASQPADRVALGGVRAMLELLRGSPRPVAISIIGSSRDVAIAARLEPKVFAEKCAGVYLNAGSGTPDKAKAVRLEYNVNLDPASYAAIFQLPCPVYWLPCFEVVPPRGRMEVQAYGSFYRFRHADVLPQLSDRVQNFFLYMYKHGALLAQPTQVLSIDFAPNWLAYLLGPKDAALLEQQNRKHRNMWSTASFLHVAGLTVTPEGKLVPLAAAEKAVYAFDPVQVRCDANGVTEWTPGAGGPHPRYLFHVRDKERYQAAMTAALCALLKELP